MAFSRFRWVFRSRNLLTLISILRMTCAFNSFSHGSMYGWIMNINSFYHCSKKAHTFHLVSNWLIFHVCMLLLPVLRFSCLSHLLISLIGQNHRYLSAHAPNTPSETEYLLGKSILCGVCVRSSSSMVQLYSEHHLSWKRNLYESFGRKWTSREKNDNIKIRLAPTNMLLLQCERCKRLKIFGFC